MNQVYLSLDLDYWTDELEFGFSFGQLMYNLRTQRPKVPVVAVMNHQQLLPHVNNSPARTLINYDEHSDLSDTKTRELECGTWVGYVNWRREGQYIWVRNSWSLDGACNGSGLGWANMEWNECVDWKSARTRVGVQRPRFPRIAQIAGVGICISPAFNNIGEKMFRRLVKHWHIPYTKGRRAETHCRRIRPSAHART